MSPGAADVTMSTEGVVSAAPARDDIPFQDGLPFEAVECLAANGVRDAVQLGSGGQGCVYSCTHDGQTAAIKFMYARNAKCGADGLPVEWRALSELGGSLHVLLLRHAFLIPLGNPVLCLVTELCDGDLQQAIAEGWERTAFANGFTRADACALAAQLCVGLAYIHEHGFVHRDVKSANILLSGRTLKFADLGLAKAIDTAAASAAHTTCGTRPFAAPEVLHGVYSARADLYSLGLVVTELASGTSFWSRLVAAGLHTQEPLRTGGTQLQIWQDSMAREWLLDATVREAAAAVPQLGVVADGFLRTPTHERMTLQQAAAACAADEAHGQSILTAHFAAAVAVLHAAAGGAAVAEAKLGCAVKTVERLLSTQPAAEQPAASCALCELLISSHGDIAATPRVAAAHALGTLRAHAAREVLSLLLSVAASSTALPQARLAALQALTTLDATTAQMVPVAVHPLGGEPLPAEGALMKMERTAVAEPTEAQRAIRIAAMDVRRAWYR